MNWLEAQPKKHPRTASRQVDGEAVIVLPGEGTVRVLNAVGSRVWELADGTRSVGDLVETIHDEYDVDRDQAREDVVEFVTSMVAANLLTMEAAT
jgi:hypothetical protein